MSKTIELRKLIVKLLKEVNKSVFYENANDKAKYPYIVYNLDNINTVNYPRNDIILTIDVWDRSNSTVTVETLTDNIEDVLNMLNKPSKNLFPTFYLEDRMSIDDEDPLIRRRQLKFKIESYYMGG
ncbi:hypothetical protein LI058_06120 [Clostridium perfringens]|uniref:hypothetical protein n=1 Tax=Clostridium perfringens TaxID=1502 RepID=UPI0022459689|nr:hypothetical protein [Clostridium perfringens]MCX0373038.1 hypothetical protein [Clostridium perfringens]MDU7067609.1 hypothetical protein [Clostridium perfringens]